ncbi:MAG: nucleotidyltransferase domain-containing protein [Candidatus Helarchaeota archaeon]
MKAVYLFGSVAREDHLPWSDIDLLVLSKNPQKVRLIVSPFLDEIFVNEGTLINAIFDDINGVSMNSKQFQKEGKPLWVKRKNS